MQFINSPLDLFKILQPHFNPWAEEVWLVGLNARGGILGQEMVFKGTVDLCHSHPRDLFRAAVYMNASSIAIAHNHPSEDPEPTEADLQSTAQLLQISDLLEIPLIDHIIFTSKTFVSLRQKCPHLFLNTET